MVRPLTGHELSTARAPLRPTGSATGYGRSAAARLVTSCPPWWAGFAPRAKLRSTRSIAGAHGGSRCRGSKRLDAPRACMPSAAVWVAEQISTLACLGETSPALRWGGSGLQQHHAVLWIAAAVVLHGVRCGEIGQMVGLVLARENNRDARRTEAPVAGSDRRLVSVGRAGIGHTTRPRLRIALKASPSATRSRLGGVAFRSARSDAGRAG